jgi:phosphatidylserine synthase
VRRLCVGLHLKDLFTAVNLLAGVVAVRFIVIDDAPRRAGYAVLVGFVLGDLLDGQVARRTGTANRFGAELDTMVDHFVHVVVPGLILLEVYDDIGHGWVGLVAMGALVAGAIVRHARLAGAPFDFPLCWCGLPRTISGFAALALSLSHLLGGSVPDGYLVGFVIVVGLSVMNVLPIPYMTHRGARAMQPWVKATLLVILVTPVATFLADRPYTFDVVLVWVLGYAALGWLPLKPEERRAFYAEYRRWSAAVAAPVRPVVS